MRYVREIEIEAPAERVWPVIEDVERWPEWTSSMTSVEIVGGGPFAEGTQAKVKQPKLPAAVWTVTRHDPPRSFRWEATSVGLRSMGDHAVRPAGEARSVATLTFEQRGPLGALTGLLFGRLIRRYVDIEAEGLKRRSES